MTECRKVQELTKEFLEKLSKVKVFKESIICNKTNNNFEYKRIRTKNNNNNNNNEDFNPYQIFYHSGNIHWKNKSKNKKPRKILPLKSNTSIINEQSKEKENNNNNNINVYQKKLKPLNKPKTSERSRDKINMKIKIKINNEEKKNEKKNDKKDDKK